MSKKFFVTILIVFNLILFSSCSSDDTIQVDITSIQEITNTAKSGTWVITNYIDSGTDETSNYSGYNFDFLDSSVRNRILFQIMQAMILFQLVLLQFLRKGRTLDL